MHTAAPSTPPRSVRLRHRAVLTLGLAACAVVGGVSLTTATGPADAAAFVPVNPCRLVDTRPGVDNVGGRTSPLGPDEAFTVEAHGDRGNCRGAAALPETAAGVQLNVTAVDATQATFLTLHPAGTERPTASHLNPTPGGPAVPNAVTVKLDADGRFVVYNRFGSVHVIIDVVGYYTDHQHDDRYYTRGEIDDLLAPAPWAIEIPGGTVQYLTDGGLPGDAHAAFVYGFRLPEAYAAGTDVLVDVTLMISSGNDCAVLLSLLDAIVVPGDGPTTVAAARFTAPSVPSLPNQTTVQLSGAGTFASATVTVRIPGDELRPGYWVTPGMMRLATDTTDTCPGGSVVGLRAREA